MIGVIGLARSTPEPFSDREVQLVTTFADQAVIAIENARLLTELRESLERQIATSDVLRVISASPGELAPVFGRCSTMRFASAMRSTGFIGTVEPDGIYVTAVRGVAAEHAALFMAGPWRPPEKDSICIQALAMATKRPVQIEDLRSAPAYRRGDPFLVEVTEHVGMRTLLLVPMLKDGEVVGGMGIFRQEVRPFTDTQIDLVENFAGAGRHRDRERAAPFRVAKSHGRAGAVGGGAEGARRRDPGGEFLARSQRRARDHRVERGAPLRDRGGRHLCLRRRPGRASAARHARHGPAHDRGDHRPAMGDGRHRAARRLGDPRAGPDRGPGGRAAQSDDRRDHGGGISVRCW